MTTEDDFNAALDKNPTDWQTRLVFADWLQDRDDIRAEGYRALAVGRKDPTCNNILFGKNCPFWTVSSITECMMLHEQWYSLLQFIGKDGLCCPAWCRRNDATRRELEDAAAIAFSKLPESLKRELLTV